MSSVEVLIKKHEDFEKTFEAHGNKIESLEAFAKDLLEHDHYDSEAIRHQLLVVREKQETQKKLALERTNKLTESKSLQQFLRNVYEVR